MRSLADFTRRAKADRCGLRELFEKAAVEIPAADLARFARTLESIKPKLDPVTRHPVESRFEVSKSERRIIAFQLLEAGIDAKTIPRLVEMSRTTWWRIRKEYREGIREEWPFRSLGGIRANAAGLEPRLTDGEIRERFGLEINVLAEVFHAAERRRAAESESVAETEAEIDRLGAYIDALVAAGERVPWSLRDELRDLGRRRLELRWPKEPPIPVGSRFVDWVIDEIGIGGFCIELIEAGFDYPQIRRSIAITSGARWAPSVGLLEAHVQRHLKAENRPERTPEMGVTDRMDKRSNVSKRLDPVGRPTPGPDLRLLPEPIVRRVEELIAA